MEPVSFDYHSSRAGKARIAQQLTWLWRSSLLLLMLALLGGGIVMLAMSLSMGWLLLGVAALPAMVFEWWQGELKDLAPTKRSGGIDQLLERDVLGLLPERPTPLDIATAASRVISGQFFSLRFGIGARFLQEIASGSAVETNTVWRQALQIREETSSSQVTGAILVIALIKTTPHYETLLAHLQLDNDDLTAGIRWKQHIDMLIAQHGKTRRTGGIARDWSFGYIPLLQRFGQNLSDQISRNGIPALHLEGHAKALGQLVDILGTSGRQNAVLVGAAGVGKTTLLYAFAEQLLDANAAIAVNLKFSQVFVLDASALISAAPARGQLENLVTQILNEAFRAKNIILCLDNAQLFFEEGIGSVDLSNLLLPILEAGRLRMILTMEEQRFLQIGQRNPGLINAMNRIMIEPASHVETVAVLQDKLITIEFQRKVTYMYQALQETYRLSERYVHDLAMPGRALKLLESAASYADNGLVTAASVQQAIEQTMHIKVGVATGEEERNKLLHLEDLIHERMINQTRAVSAISDALRRARAGVRNQNRPIGTFLFLGPTGVGKTELAKALADVYFGGEERIIRLDLNEFVRSEDVSRLIADPADDANSLTAQAMKQPFSVVLLDEIEKAHPAVLTTLLQLLDEGVMRDVKNREVSFRDAIIIATSNAGAERIREYIERGYQLEQFEKQFVDELISTNQFRPEFLNRFDEIVTFRPLNKDELLQVVDLILAGINKTLALQKVMVVVEQDAKIFLVDRGYDPRLGARPMRRIVQRAVENTVAKQMLEGTITAGSTVVITLEQVQTIIGTETHAAMLITPRS